MGVQRKLWFGGHIKNYWWLGVALFGLIAAFQNCAPKENMTSDTVTEEGSSTICDARKLVKSLQSSTKKITSPFDSGKIQLSKVQAFASNQQNAENNLYAIIINMDCTRDQGTSEFVSQITSSKTIPESMKSYVVSYHLDDSMTEQELIEKVNSETCISGLTYDSKIQGGDWSHNSNKMPALEFKEYSLNDKNYFDGSNDPMDKYQFYHRRLETAKAWDYFYHDIVGIKQTTVVAIIDSGMDYANADFANRLWRNANNENGFDFVNNDNDPTADHYHGVFVAGIIGAEPDNNVGLRGIAKSNIEFMTVKVLASDNTGLAANFANGIRYAADNGADVINSSLFVNSANGGILMRDAFAYAINNGAFIAQSAGNDSKNINNDPTSYPTIHTRDYQGVMSVASLHVHNETLSEFSNFGDAYVEMAAYGGGGIVSFDLNSNLRVAQGTSFAAPMVAAAAAQMIGIFKTHNISYNPALVEGLIRNNGSVVNNGLGGQVQGAKVLNLRVLSEQLQQLFPQTKIPEPTLPEIPNPNEDSTKEDQCV